MAITTEVQASIIKVAGDWALAMASSSGPDGKPIEPSQMSGKLHLNFDLEYKFLIDYIDSSGENIVDIMVQQRKR